MLTRMYGALPESIGDAQVLIIDGASDTYGANEIVRRSVRQFIRALRRLIPPDGAVLVLAHVDKAIARGRESGDHYSGSTAWNNSVRARWALRAEGDGLMLTVEKANHAQAGAEIRLRWDPQAHFHVADDAPVDGRDSRRDPRPRGARGILAAMRECATADITVPSATSGRRTTYHVLASQPSFPAALRGESRALHGRFWRHIEALANAACCANAAFARRPANGWES